MWNKWWLENDQKATCWLRHQAMWSRNWNWSTMFACSVLCKVPAMMDQKLKITRPPMGNPPYIGLSLIEEWSSFVPFLLIDSMIIICSYLQLLSFHIDGLDALSIDFVCCICSHYHAVYRYILSNSHLIGLSTCWEIKLTPWSGWIFSGTFWNPYLVYKLDIHCI